MILYILALGSPTHPGRARGLGARGRARYRWGAFYGQEHLGFAPLFGHQYSHVWIDFRGIQDAFMRGKGIDYFENSRRATLAQRAYAIANPDGWRGYGDATLGPHAPATARSTATLDDRRPRSAVPHLLRRAAPRSPTSHDDGTIAPTAAGGSIAVRARDRDPGAVAMRERYGEHRLSTVRLRRRVQPHARRRRSRVQHGRVVPGVGWFDTDYLGIDQGPILAMIENYRSGLVWQHDAQEPARRARAAARRLHAAAGSTQARRE